MLRVRSLLSGRPSPLVSNLLSPTSFYLCLIRMNSLSLHLYHPMLQCMSPSWYFYNVLLTKKKTITGVRRESTTLLPLWQTSHRQQMELCRHFGGCLSWNVHYLYTSPSCRIRWFIPPFTVVLAYPGWFRCPPTWMGFIQGDHAA